MFASPNFYTKIKVAPPVAHNLLIYIKERLDFN